MPACRYIGSVSSWYWTPPATAPPTSMTSSTVPVSPSRSPATTSTGSGSPHQRVTDGSARIAHSAATSSGRPGRTVASVPASRGRADPGVVMPVSLPRRPAVTRSAGPGGNVERGAVGQRRGEAGADRDVGLGRLVAGVGDEDGLPGRYHGGVARSQQVAVLGDPQGTPGHHEDLRLGQRVRLVRHVPRLGAANPVNSTPGTAKRGACAALMTVIRSSEIDKLACPS